MKRTACGCPSVLPSAHPTGLVIDGGALGELPREHLLPDLQAALARTPLRRDAGRSARKSMGLGGAIADAVVERLGSAHLGIRDNGASR